MSLCDLCASQATLDELKEVLTREKFRLSLADAARQEFLDRAENNARLFLVREEDCLSVDPACRDPKDNKLLAVAAESEAASPREQRRGFAGVDPWNGVRIARPAEFLSPVG
jgi:putative PIN family toxin of toxin-antitoxin system